MVPCEFHEKVLSQKFCEKLKIFLHLLPMQGFTVKIGSGVSQISAISRECFPWKYSIGKCRFKNNWIFVHCSPYYMLLNRKHCLILLKNVFAMSHKICLP